MEYSYVEFVCTCIYVYFTYVLDGAGSKYIGLLWESSTNDCTGTDASCVVKFSAVPTIPRGSSGSNLLQSGWTPYNGLAS